MQMLDTLTSALCTVLRVTGSIIDGPHSAVFLDGKGVGGFDEDDDDVGAETFTGVEAFGAPGIVWRPRPPETIGGDLIGAEAFGVRTADGPQPVAYRDLRWNKSYPAPKPGSKAFVGDAGGFLDFYDIEKDADGWGGPDPAPKVRNQGGTLYFPYAKNASGVAQKAMAISFDPDGESPCVREVAA